MELTFVQYVISAEVAKPDKNRVLDTDMMPQPQSWKVVQQFLRLVNYLGKFFPHLLTVAEPFWRILEQKKEWCWNAVQEEF